MPKGGTYQRKPSSFFLRGQSSQLVDGQLNQAKDVLEQLEVYEAHPGEADSTDKRRRKMIDKEREGNIEREFLTRRE